MSDEIHVKSDRKRLHATVHGWVQGVSFRYYTRQRARALGLRGWVRNRGDGTVEVVAEGSEDAVRKLLSWLHAGPSLARVQRVETEWQPPADNLTSFEVRY